jgi:hypothetical protein
MTKQELLQSLFYDLLRDGAPAGDIEHAIREFETLCYGRLQPQFITYTNKHLAGYANELAERVLDGLEKGKKHHEVDTGAAGESWR